MIDKYAGEKIINATKNDPIYLSTKFPSVYI